MNKEDLLKQVDSNNSINVKDIINSTLRYKWSIIFITILFTLISIVFAYTKPNIYSSSTTLELVSKKGGGGATDFMLEAFGGNNVNVSNEIELIKSRFLTTKALEYLDLNTRYFETKDYRTTELYKNSPFIVNKLFIDDFISSKQFIIKPVDSNTFNISIKKPSPYLSIKGMLKLIGIIPYSQMDKITYNEDHTYGETIENEYFSLKVEKVFELNKDKEYTFNFISDLGIYGMFRNNIKVGQLSRNSTIIKLTLEDTNSLRAKEILTAIVNAYMDEEVSQKTKEANLTLEFIDEQLDAINERLKVSENNLEVFKEENKVIGLSEQASMITTKLSNNEAKLEDLQTEINILSNLRRYINSNQNLSGISVGSVGFADPSLGSLITKLQEEDTKRISLLVNYTDIHPDVVKAGKNISNLKRTIKATLANNLKQLSQRRLSLKTSIAKYNKSITTLPKQESQLSRLTRYYNIDEKIYSFLLEKKAETAILKSSTIAKSRLLDEAIENSHPIKPKRSMIVLIGIFVGILAGLAWAFLREMMNNTIKNSDEIEKLSSIPIYGIIPKSKNKKTAKLADEAYRAIRTNLQFLPKHNSSNIISITSSVSGEGKTTIASNLAKILGQANKKVIVLDLDLRKSSVHMQFDIPNNIGISNYLTDQNTLEDVIINIENTNVDVITTGTLPPNPSELILTEKMKDLVSILKEKYDYVIFDTPPVGLVTDALILMNYADIALLVARASYTRKEFIKNLDRLAQEHSQHTFGMILNGVEIGEKYGYGYGSNYGYGYGNDKYYKNR